MWIDQYRNPNQRRIDFLMAYSADKSKLCGRRLRACILANELLASEIDRNDPVFLSSFSNYLNIEILSNSFIFLARFLPTGRLQVAFFNEKAAQKARNGLLKDP